MVHVLQSEMMVARYRDLEYYSYTVNYDGLIGEYDMFTKNELVNIGKALVLQEKSVQRLAAKEGQPDSVAVEYRKVAVEIGDLLKKVTIELSKMEQDAKKPVKP